MRTLTASKWAVILWSGIALLCATQFNACSDVGFEKSLSSVQNEMQSSAIVLINGDDRYTRDRVVQVQLDSKNSDEVYVTNDSKCESGGKWEPLVAQKEWTLGQGNKSVPVYAKFRNSVRKVSTACVSDSIIHDDQLPLVVLQNPSFATNEPTPRFLFSATDAVSGLESTTCQWPGGEPAPCSMSSSNGNLAEGRYLVNVVAKDNAGNISDPYSQDMIVDRTKPRVILLDRPPVIGNSLDVKITFSATDDRSGIRSVECSWGNNTSYAACESPIVRTMPAEGSYKFYVRATDIAGNVSDEVLHDFKIDTSAPTVRILSGPLEFDRNTSATFTFDGNDEGVPLTVFQCRVDSSGAYSSCTSPRTLSGLAPGTHTFEVRGQNAAGLWSEPAVRTWVVDPNKPLMNWEQTPLALDNTRVAPFRYTITDGPNGSDIASVQCSLNGATFSTCSRTNITLTVDRDGDHNFRVRATDRAGNVETLTYDFKVDTVVPTIAFTNNVPDPSNATSFRFEFTANDNGTAGLRAECLLDTGAWGNCQSLSAHNVTGLSDNNNVKHRFTIRAVDAAGNVSPTASQSWLVDATRPVVSYTTEPATVAQESGTISLRFDVVESGSGIQSLVCTLDGTAVPCQSGVTKTFSGLTPKNYRFEVTATDRAGNVGTAPSKSWTIRPDQTDDFNGIPARQALTKVDILFVVDESSSMQPFLKNVNDGFKSVTGAQFPSDTIMAVTNMAPAYVTNTTTRAFDRTRGAVNKSFIPYQPGFMKLVNQASINAWKPQVPSGANSMSLLGCTQTRFKPTDKDANGVSCLEGATQIADSSIGYEAGVVSLSQLNEVMKTDGTSLFRSGTYAHVIFVSDTHDAGTNKGGTNYYGMAGGLSSRIPYDALVSRIYEHNPTLKGLRFNGIVPLPPAGHPILQGLNRLGDLPPSGATSAVEDPSLNEYSYLPYIKQSNGVAMHITSNNWTSAISNMVANLSEPVAPIVQLTQPAGAILEVRVNDVLFTAYTLLPGGTRIQLTPQNNWPATINVRVKYSPL